MECSRYCTYFLWIILELISTTILHRIETCHFLHLDIDCFNSYIFLLCVHYWNTLNFSWLGKLDLLEVELENCRWNVQCNFVFLHEVDGAEICLHTDMIIHFRFAWSSTFHWIKDEMDNCMICICTYVDRYTYIAFRQVETFHNQFDPFWFDCIYLISNFKMYIYPRFHGKSGSRCMNHMRIYSYLFVYDMISCS